MSKWTAVGLQKTMAVTIQSPYSLVAALSSIASWQGCTLLKDFMLGICIDSKEFQLSQHSVKVDCMLRSTENYGSCSISPTKMGEASKPTTGEDLMNFMINFKEVMEKKLEAMSRKIDEKLEKKLTTINIGMENIVM